MERTWQPDTAVSPPPLTHGTMKSINTTSRPAVSPLPQDTQLKSFGRDLQNWDVHGFHVTPHPHQVNTSCANTLQLETSLVLTPPPLLVNGY